MLSIQWKVPEREPPNGGSDAENACEASGTHALRVQVGGGAPTPHGFPRSGKKVLIGFARYRHLCAPDSRFAKPRNSLLGRAKNCQWQVFVRRRPPKQGELRTDVSKATMFQGEREQKHARRAAPTPLLSCFFKSR